MQYKEVEQLCKEYYRLPNNGAGGSLHIALDDSAVSNDNIRFCIEWAKKQNDELGITLGNALLTLALEEREKMYRDYNYGVYNQLDRGEIDEEEYFKRVNK